MQRTRSFPWRIQQQIILVVWRPGCSQEERQELYTRTVRPIYAAAIACLALTVTTFVVWSFGVSQDTLKALLALSSTISVIITGLLTFIGLSVRQFSQRHVRQERFAERPHNGSRQSRHRPIA